MASRPPPLTRCPSGKRLYRNLEAIAQALRDRPSLKLYHYLCPSCRGYHLTKTRKKGCRERLQRLQMRRFGLVRKKGERR